MLPLAWMAVPPAGSQEILSGRTGGLKKPNTSPQRPAFLGALGTFSRQELEQLLPSGGSTP